MENEVLPKVFLSIAVLGGVALCFFGCRLFKLALAIAGLACGSAIAAYVVWKLTAPPEQIAAALTYPDIIRAMFKAENPAVLVVWATAGGITGAVLLLLMHRVGVFVLGAGLGAVLANTTMVRASANAYLMVLAILGLIGGVLALILRKTIVVVSTALNGALALMFGIYALLKNYSPQEAVNALKDFGRDAYVVLACTIVLGVIGAYVQFSTSPKESGEKKEKGK